ncbi:MAG: peptide ABC transporter permease, partial [Planctomycetes bacterium]|nr:peptide ABC transporter permease [Planctomycetota bacterium]
MTAYFVRRFLLMIPTLFGITMLVFTITRFTPGGPIDQMIARMQAEAATVEGSTVAIPEDVLEELKKHFHFDKPVWEAYLYWLGDLLTFDLGTSYKYNIPVVDVITSRFPVSIYFGLIGFFLAYAVCIPLGVFKAIKHGSAFDFTSSALVFMGYSIPGWALGAVLLVLLGGGSFWDVVPLGGFRSENWE